MTEKPKRGRPKGSGKDDEPHLLQVARLLIEDNRLKPTTAMYRVIRQGKWPETDTTLIRRWQVKWKEGSERFLETARQERAARLAAQERRSQQDFRRTGGMPDYIKAALPQGYKIPRGIVNDLAFMKLPTGLDLNNIERATRAHKSIIDAMKAMAPYEKAMRQHYQALKALKQYEDGLRISNELEQAIAIQRLMKF